MFLEFQITLIVKCVFTFLSMCVCAGVDGMALVDVRAQLVGVPM